MNCPQGEGMRGGRAPKAIRFTAPGKAGLRPSSWPHVAGDGASSSMVLLSSSCVLGSIKVSSLFVKRLHDHNDFCLST